MRPSTEASRLQACASFGARVVLHEEVVRFTKEEMDEALEAP